jgi:hypothetical protein
LLTHFESVKNPCLNILEQGSVVLNTWYFGISRLQYSQREVDGSTVWHIERLSPWSVTPLKLLVSKRTVLSPALESYSAARTISWLGPVFEFLELHFALGFSLEHKDGWGEWRWLAGWSDFVINDILLTIQHNLGIRIPFSPYLVCQYVIL